MCDSATDLSSVTKHNYSKSETLTIRGSQSDPSPLEFFGFKFLFLDRLPKALGTVLCLLRHLMTLIK